VFGVHAAPYLQMLIWAPCSGDEVLPSGLYFLRDG